MPKIKRFEWTEAIISVLGLVPDTAIAKRTGIPRERIQQKRQELNIPPVKN